MRFRSFHARGYFVLIQWCGLVRLALRVVFGLLFVFRSVIFTRATYTYRRVVNGVITEVGAVILMGLLVSGKNSDSSRLVLFRVQVRLHRLVIGQQHRNRVGASLIVRSANFRTRRIIALTLRGIQVVTFLLGLLYFRRVTQVRLMQSYGQGGVRFRRI